MGKFVCSLCGAQSLSWVGKCPECKSWNSYVEENSRIQERGSKFGKDQNIKPISIAEVEVVQENRIKSGIGELDRVLGGGIVNGSAVLIAGEPGIGKSTLLIQVAGKLSRSLNVLYVSGEESPSQIKMRSERLDVNSKNLIIFPQTEIFQIEEQINQMKPDFIIIDSIQTVNRGDVDSPAGSITQVKESAAYLVKLAKEKNIPTRY